MRGVVRLFAYRRERGADLALTIAQAGELFGRVAPGRAWRAAASAIGDARVLMFAPSDVDRLVANSPSFANFLSAGLEVTRERAERKLIDRQTKTVATRLIGTSASLRALSARLARMAIRWRSGSRSRTSPISFTPDGPVVTRIMNDLRRRGALDYRRDLICVNHLALRSLAQEKPADL